MTVKRQELQHDLFRLDNDSRHKFVVTQVERFHEGVSIQQWWEIDHFIDYGDGEVGETTDIVGPILVREQAEKIAEYLNNMGRLDLSHLM